MPGRIRPYGSGVTESTTIPRSGAPLVVLHLAAVVLAASSGYLARWSFHASGRPDADGPALEILVLLAVAGGLLSVACQAVAILVPDPATRRERLVAQSVGVAASTLPLLLIALIGTLTLGSLLDLAGDVLSVGVALLLILCVAGAAHLATAGSSPRRATLLLAGSTALVVSYFSAWWFLNGLALLLNLLGVEPAGAG